MMRAPVLLLVLGFANSLSAQEPLTLRDAVRHALAAHPSLGQAEAVIERAAAARREQQSSLLPALHADASYTRFQEPMVVAPLHGFDPRNPPLFDRALVQGGVTLGYTLWDGGARGARVDRGAAQLDAAHAAAATNRANVIAETVRRYGALRTVQQQVTAHEAAVRALESEHARAAQLLAQGRVARVAVLRAAAALSRAQAELVAARTQRTVAEAGLARVTGLAESELRARPLTFPQDSGGAVPAGARPALTTYAQHPELQRLRAQVAAAGAGEAEARASWWPRVLLGSRYVRYGSGEGDAGGEWQGGLQLHYALFTAGGRPAAQDRARAERRLAEAELAMAELRMAEAVDGALAELSNARARADALQAAVTQFEEVARIELLALAAGAGVQNDYLAAETDLLRTRASLWEARFAELLAQVELARASGTLTWSWIESLETSP